MFERDQGHWTARALPDMNEAKITAALNFLEGSPRNQEVLSRVEKLSAENVDRDPEKSVAIMKMFQNLVGRDGFEEARLVCAALDSAHNKMSAEQIHRFEMLMRPYVAFSVEMENLQRLEKQANIGLGGSRT